MESQIGYNFFMKLNEKKVAGVTQDDFNISAKVVDSITKDDAGSMQSTVISHEITGTIAGKLKKKGGVEDSLDMDDLMSNALKVGSEAEIPFVYNRASGKAYTGKLIITSYSESTNSEDVGTWSMGVKVIGKMTEQTL